MAESERNSTKRVQYSGFQIKPILIKCQNVIPVPLVLNNQFDKIQKRAIVTINKLNIRTPPEGAENTNRGLTLHAGVSSMAGWARSYQRINQSSIAAIAIDGFLLSGGGSWK